MKQPKQEKATVRSSRRAELERRRAEGMHPPPCPVCGAELGPCRRAIAHCPLEISEQRP